MLNCWYWLSKISLNAMLVSLFNWFLLLCDVLQILAIKCFEWVSSQQIDSMQYCARRGCVNPGLRHLPQRAPFLLHSRGSAASAPTPPLVCSHSCSSAITSFATCHLQMGQIIWMCDWILSCKRKEGAISNILFYLGQFDKFVQNSLFRFFQSEGWNTKILFPD